MEYECTCKECGKVFTVPYKCKIKDYCSKSCSQKARWRNTERKTKEFTCESCGKVFYIPISDHRIKEGKNIRFCSHKCCGEANKKGSIIKCKQCGKNFYSTRNEFCSQDCARKYRKENYIHKTYYENGYICEFKKGYNKKGNVKQHRHIMEEYLGRKLNDDEVVHHKNGIKTDNRVENLEVMSRSEHSSYHRKKEKAEGKHLFGGYNNN